MSKTLDRIGLLLNQAENTSNPEEAAAFMEKAQKLATLAAVDLEVARQRQSDKTKRETPEQRNITVAERTSGQYTYRSKVQANAPEFVSLFSVISGANDVKINIAHNSLYVIAFGFPTDIDVCDALFASLKVQMVAAANAEIAKGDYKKEITQKWSEAKWEYVSKPLDARVFRTRFYQAFIAAVGQRLRAARAEALLAAESTTFDIDVTDEQGEVHSEAQTGGLVLIEKGVEVSDFYTRTSTAKGSYRGGAGRSTGHSVTATTAGREAGQRARIGTQAGITSGRASVGA